MPAAEEKPSSPLQMMSRVDVLRSCRAGYITIFFSNNVTLRRHSLKHVVEKEICSDTDIDDDQPGSGCCKKRNARFQF
jgi:hypothetical protein